MNKSNIVILILLVLVLAVAGYFTYTAYVHRDTEESSDASASLNAASGAVFTDLDGNEVTLDAYKGMVRVVNSWASWSPLSTQELLNLERLSADYKDKNVAVIAINRKETKEKAKSYLNTIGSFSNVKFVIDLNDTFYKSVEGYSMPETIIYNQNGDVVYHKRGTISFDEIQQYVNEALLE